MQLVLKRSGVGPGRVQVLVVVDRHDLLAFFLLLVVPGDHLFLCLSVDHRLPDRRSAAELGELDDELRALAALDVGLQSFASLDLLPGEPQAGVVFEYFLAH